MLLSNDSIAVKFDLLSVYDSVQQDIWCRTE